MSERVKEGERVRRAYAPRGQRSQVRVTFLLDNENVDHFNKQTNKSRYLNRLVAIDREL